MTRCLYLCCICVCDCRYIIYSPCKAIAPTVESLSSKYAKEAVFLKVDVDRVSDVARDAGVTAMPSFGFYGEGRLVELMKGADARGLEERIKKYAAAYTKNRQIQHNQTQHNMQESTIIHGGSILRLTL